MYALQSKNTYLNNYPKFWSIKLGKSSFIMRTEQGWASSVKSETNQGWPQRLEWKDLFVQRFIRQSIRYLLTFIMHCNFILKYLFRSPQTVMMLNYRKKYIYFLKVTLGLVTLQCIIKARRYQMGCLTNLYLYLWHYNLYTSNSQVILQSKQQQVVVKKNPTFLCVWFSVL